MVLQITTIHDRFGGRPSFLHSETIQSYGKLVDFVHQMLRYVKFHQGISSISSWMMFRYVSFARPSTCFQQFSAVPGDALAQARDRHLVLRKARAFVVELEAFLGTSRF